MYRREVRKIVYPTKTTVQPIDVAKAHAATPFAPLRPRMRDGSYVGVSMEAFRLYDSTYLLYTDGWQAIDQLSAYLVNGKMREMCRPQKTTSLVFDAVSEDLVRLFNDTFFVVGMTHVQKTETIEIGSGGHRAADTQRDRRGGDFAQPTS